MVFAYVEIKEMLCGEVGSAFGAAIGVHLCIVHIIFLVRGEGYGVMRGQ